MARLSLAFLLALGSHVILFFMVLPGQGEFEPQLKGIRQVTVRLFHPAPEPVEVIDAVPLAVEPDNSAPLEEFVEKIPEPVQEEKSVIIPPSPTQPIKRKAVPSPEVVEEIKQVQNMLKQDELPVQEERTTQKAIQEAKGSGTTVQQAAESVNVHQAVPLYRFNDPPEYPNLARRRGWEGTVLLEVEVSSDGWVGSVRVHTTSSFDLLDNAALDAVRKWQFKPGMKGDQPVAMQVLVPVHFVLKDMQ